MSSTPSRAASAPSIYMLSDDAGREFQRVGPSRFTLTVPKLGIAFNVDRLRRTGQQQLWAELSVECDLPGARTVAGCLSSADFNLSSLTARLGMARHLENRSKTRPDDVDWLGLLEELCMRVIAEDRAGDAAVSLRDVEPLGEEPSIDVSGVRLLTRHPTCFFGDGGSAKSLIALYLAGELARRGIRVGFFDWELAAVDHRDRLAALYGAELPDVRYLRCERPLTQSVDHLARTIARDRLEYVVFDSVAFAVDGPPEAAEVAGRYFQALRQLGTIGSLHIAHVSKTREGDRSSEQRPFGSAFWHNGARSTWFVKQAEAATDQTWITVGLFNRKSNLGRLQPAVAFRVTFAPGRTSIVRADLAETPDLAANLSIKQRMQLLLRGGPRSIEAIAEELDAKEDSIRRTANRYREQFVLLDGGSLALKERAS